MKANVKKQEVQVPVVIHQPLNTLTLKQQTLTCFKCESSINAYLLLFIKLIQ